MSSSPSVWYPGASCLSYRLMADSVALVLQSCLGGSAHFYHVLEVSHNHFRFSVSCKAVGFFVYGLWRIIGSSFDVYFHLWSNGALHWEREKSLWEAEEAKKWTEVLSRSQKRNAKSKAAPAKKVRFNPQLIQASPPRKFKPVLPKAQTICFGSFSTDIDPALQSVNGFRVGSSDHYSNSPDSAVKVIGWFSSFSPFSFIRSKSELSEPSVQFCSERGAEATDGSSVQVCAEEGRFF